MTKLVESRRKLKSRLDVKQDISRSIPALMGNGNGVIEVPNQPGYVYIRVGDGDLGQAFNNRCQLADNLAIYVGYDPVTDPDRRIFQVLSVRMADYAGAGNAPAQNLPPHHATHEYGGGDDVYISWRRLMGLRVGRPVGFQITVDNGVMLRGGAWMPIPSQNLDLTLMKPAGFLSLYVLIAIDSTGTATATPGTPVAGGLTIANCPVPAADEIPLAAVRLYGTQTAIGDTPAAPDIVDLRFPTTNTMSGGGVPGGLDTYIQFNDGGAFGGDADFVWNKITNIATATQFRASRPLNTSTVTFAGAGLDDMSIAGAVTINDRVLWRVTINGTAPDTCEIAYAFPSIYPLTWIVSEAALALPVAPYDYSGVGSTLVFAANVGHTMADEWTWELNPPLFEAIEPVTSTAIFVVDPYTTRINNKIAFNGINIYVDDQVAVNASGIGIAFQCDAGNGSGDGGNFSAFAGVSTDRIGGQFYLQGGDSVNSDGGGYTLVAGDGGTAGGAALGDGGDFILKVGTAQGAGNHGRLYFQNGALDFLEMVLSSVTTSRAYTFPDVSGIFALGAGTCTAATANDVTVANHTHAITGFLTSVTAHNVLSATHGDSLADNVVRGDILFGNATPKIARLAKGAAFAVLTGDGTDTAWSTYLLAGTAGGKTTFAVTNAKTLTLTATDDFNLTIPKTGTAAIGTGTATRLAVWSDTNTLAAGTIVQPAANVLTVTNAAAATLALAITAGKTLTLTATDNSGITFTGACVLTIPTAGAVTAALLGTANVFTANQTISNTAPALDFTDTTASAKSLTIAVDANIANLRSSAGAAGSLMTLDLANNRVGIGISPTHVFDVYGIPNDYVAKIKNFYGAAGGCGLWVDTYWNTAGNIVLRLTTNNENNEIFRVTGTGNVKMGGTADRASTSGTNHLDIFDGSAPTGTLANGCSIYSASGELYTMDAAGNATLQTPHDERGEWVFLSKNTVTGKVIKVDMERMMKAINEKFGWDFVREYVEK